MANREGGLLPAHRPIAAFARSRARSLRSEMTDAERKLWQKLRAHRLSGCSFRRQAIVGSFIVDFICHDANLIIEIDGGHHADSGRDALRDRWLNGKGYRVLRFWNSDVLQNCTGVVETILKVLKETPLPNPPPQGGRELVAGGESA